MDELVDIAVHRLRETDIVHSGDAIVVMAGSRHGGTALTDTVRMVIVP